MDEKYSALFTPWKIGNVEIKNRIVQCSMGGTSLFGWLEPCHFDKEAANFLLNRAQDASVWSSRACSVSVTPWAADGSGRTRRCLRNSPTTWSSTTRPAPSCSFSSPLVSAAPWLLPLDGHSEQQQGARRPCQARHRRQLLLRFRFRYPEPLAGGHALPSDDRRRDPRDGRCVRQDREAAA